MKGPRLDLAFPVILILCSHLFCRANVIEVGEEEDADLEDLSYDDTDNVTAANDEFEDYIVHRVSGFHDNDGEEEPTKTAEEILAEMPRAPYLDTTKWRNGWRKYPLYLIILGGFRWDFLKAHKSNLTSFIYLRKHGSIIPMVKPVFPPEDYPVWTSLATGLYPEEHNIIGDVMFDLRTRSFFDRGNPSTTTDPEWWKEVEPFWSVAAKHGRKVALFNWHDCQLPTGGGGKGKKPSDNPDDCRPYKMRDTVQPRQEIARMFDEAFNRLYTKDYDIAVVYTDAIRRASEIHGPLSKELNKVLHDIDDVLQTKLIDIMSKDEKAGIKMNLMVISDYGMSDARELEPIFLDDYLDMDQVQYIILSSGYAALVPYALTHQKILEDCKQLRYGVDVFSGNPLQDPPVHAPILPSMLHYEKGEWTQDVLLVTKPGYQLVVNSTDEKIVCVPGSGYTSDWTKARIGFNPYPTSPVKPKIKKGIKPTREQLHQLRAWNEFQLHKNDMNVMAYAMGPDFKKNFQSYEEVEVVDFYQIFCFLLRIPAGVHSGSWDRIASMLTISGVSVLRPPPATLLLLLLALVTLAQKYR